MLSGFRASRGSAREQYGVATVFVLNVVACSVVEKLVQAGVEPPIRVTADAGGGNVWNKRWLERYRGRVPHL